MHDDPTSAIRRCPQCGSPSPMRVRRRPEDRAQQTSVGLRRYQCRAAGCGWEGLLPRSGATARRRRPAWVRFAPGLMAFASLMALGAAAVVSGLHGLNPDTAVARWIEPGESFDGVRLPTSHPLLTQVAENEDPRVPDPHDLAPAATPEGEPPGAAPAGVRRAATLRLRRHCAWGDPGRNPYRGTATQALAMAQLPPEVVKRIAADIAKGQVTDRVTIQNASIRADASGREFSPHSVAMTYGDTLCLDTRVNFAPGHVERGDLFEATADDGRTYAVMVPEVCGNVSVLGERAEREELGERLWAADDERRPDFSARRLPAALTFADDPGIAGALASQQRHAVPEPGSLWLVLPALALLAALSRRR